MRDRTKWTAIVVLSVLLVAALAMIGLLLAERLLVPKVAAERITSQIGRTWDGPVEVSGLQIAQTVPQVNRPYTADANNGTTLFIRSLEFSDQQSRRWIHAENIQVDLQQFYTNPRLQQIAVAKLTLTLHKTNGKVRFPTIDTEQPKDLSSLSQLKNIYIEQLIVEVPDPNVRYSGPLNADFYSQPDPDAGVILGGEITSPSGTAKNDRTSRLRARFELTADANTDYVSSESAVMLDSVDLRPFPFIPSLHKAIGLEKQDPLKNSDVVIRTRTHGPLITIDEAELTNSAGAMSVQSGGTINLRTRQIDMYVVAAPLAKIDKQIIKLPFAQAFVNLRDNLVRLRVKGHIDQPYSQLIEKEPLTDITEGTFQFFTDTIESGGELGQDIISSVFGIFARKEPNSTPAPDEQVDK